MTQSVRSVNENGDVEWRFPDGRLHREDGPAFEGSNGDKEWSINGLFHREDGPALEHASGARQWRINGMLHREDGPALEWPTGAKHWYINGNKLTLTEELKITHPVLYDQMLVYQVMTR
jgi:hypothetical protein